MTLRFLLKFLTLTPIYSLLDAHTPEILLTFKLSTYRRRHLTPSSIFCLRHIALPFLLSLTVVLFSFAVLDYSNVLS